MASLRTAIGTSTPCQRKMLVLTARKQGISLDQLRDYVGGSLRQLSAKEASDWINRLGGGELPHQPGRKPAPYAGRRRRTDAVRMICDDHVEQIERLMDEYFDSQGQSTAWLQKNFDANKPRDLLTAIRAGHVIRVLKDMLARQAEPVLAGEAQR